MGGLFYYNGLVFIIPFEKNYKYCLIKFSGLEQEVFPIFKPLNSTETAYDNWKSYDQKSSILWFPEMPRTEHTHNLFSYHIVCLFYCDK